MSDSRVAHGAPTTTLDDDRAGDLLDAVAALLGDVGLAAETSEVATDLRSRPPDTAMLTRLALAFRLSPFECDLLLLAGLPEEAAAVTEAARRLHPRGEPVITPGLATEVLGLDAIGRDQLRRTLTSGPLVRFGLVTPVDDAPFPEQGRRLARHLWGSLRGVPGWPLALRAADDDVVTPQEPIDQLGPAVARPGPSIVLVTGPTSRGDAELAAAATSSLLATGRRCGVFDSAVVVEDAEAVTVHTVARDAVPVVRGAVAGRPLPRHPGVVVVCSDAPVPFEADARPIVTIDLGEATLGTRVEMWRGLVPELNGASERLAGLVRLDRVRAAESVVDARAAAALADRALVVDDVVGGARRRSDRNLPPSVRRVVPRASWSDLVTTTDNEQRLRSVVDRLDGQVTVLDTWRFASSRVLPGASVLLSGPPGTGKTLSVEIVAAALGLELLVVDLAALVSKWLGETEKNIAEVFDAAERSQAVLFFDEADAIFGKRTDAGDAQSRWANLETAYLLGRVDRFDGVVALATNLRGNIDDAFVRRLDVIVEFDEPTEIERRTLWRLHLPPSAPVAADVDVDALAALYPVTGALIRNTVLGAAFAAATAHDAITQHRLLDAMEREYQKAGRSFPGRPRARAHV